MPPLVSDFANQDVAFASAFAILESAITTRAFPAASVAITKEGKLIALKALGKLTYEGAPPVSYTHLTLPTILRV